MNSPERRKKLVTETFGSYTFTVRKPGNLRSYHHLLYSALRHRDWKTGFKPITNPRQLAASYNGNPYEARQLAIGELDQLSRLAKDSKLPKWSQKRLNTFLAPFQGTVTPEMLIKAFEYILETK